MRRVAILVLSVLAFSTAAMAQMAGMQMGQAPAGQAAAQPENIATPLLALPENVRADAGVERRLDRLLGGGLLSHGPSLASSCRACGTPPRAARARPAGPAWRRAQAACPCCRSGEP